MLSHVLAWSYKFFRFQKPCMMHQFIAHMPDMHGLSDVEHAWMESRMLTCQGSNLQSLHCPASDMQHVILPTLCPRRDRPDCRISRRDSSSWACRLGYMHACVCMVVVVVVGGCVCVCWCLSGLLVMLLCWKPLPVQVLLSK